MTHIVEKKLVSLEDSVDMISSMFQMFSRSNICLISEFLIVYLCSSVIEFLLSEGFIFSPDNVRFKVPM